MATTRLDPTSATPQAPLRHHRAGSHPSPEKARIPTRGVYRPPAPGSVRPLPGRVTKEEKSGIGAFFSWILKLLMSICNALCGTDTKDPQPRRADTSTRGGATATCSSFGHSALPPRSVPKTQRAFIPLDTGRVATTPMIPTDVARACGGFLVDKELSLLEGRQILSEIREEADRQTPAHDLLAQNLFRFGLSLVQVGTLIDVQLADRPSQDRNFKTNVLRCFREEYVKNLYRRLRLESPHQVLRKECGEAGDCMLWSIAHFFEGNSRRNVDIKRLRRRLSDTFLRKINTDTAYRAYFAELISDPLRVKDIGPRCAKNGCRLTIDERTLFTRNGMRECPAHLRRYLEMYAGALDTMHIWNGDIEADLLSDALGRSIVIINRDHEISHIAGHEYFPTTEEEWRERPPLTIYNPGGHYQCVTFTRRPA